MASKMLDVMGTPIASHAAGAEWSAPIRNSKGSMSMENDNAALLAEMARLRAENEGLKAKSAARQTISFKVSEKGAVSVYGLGRFPVTLDSQQWGRLLAQANGIRAFIETNKSRLATKE